MLIPKDEQHVPEFPIIAVTSQYCLVRGPKDYRYNQTKDRVSPSSSLLISNKMASSDAGQCSLRCSGVIAIINNYYSSPNGL